MRVPQFEFTPFSLKQLQVSAWWTDKSPYKDYETIICDGSVRAGKTLIMSTSFIEWSMTNFTDEQFGIAGKTIGSLRRNVLTPLKRILKGRGGYRIKDKRADNLLEITRGNVTNHYYVFGGKDEGSQDLVQGLTAAGFFFDEVALMPQSFVNQATARVSKDGGKYWFNCNPDGPYHWFKLEWLDQPKKHKVLHIHFTMNDNPSLSDEVRDRYNRMYTGVFYQRYILGLWVLAEGVVYDNFNAEQMVVDPPDPSHITKYVVSSDYGALNPTVFLLWGFCDGVWYCLKEYYFDGRNNPGHRQKSDDQYANDLGTFLGPISAPIILDPSAKHFAIKLEQRGYEVIPADNDVLDGIRLTQSCMSNGLIKFTPGLSSVFKELSSYIWDSKVGQKGEDKVVKEHDHAMDAMRYFCMGVLAPNQNEEGIQVFDHY